jgi:hypothetical protein
MEGLRAIGPTRFADETGASVLRLAIISTPRSGNTWLRRLLATALGLDEQAALGPDEVPWDDLPRRYILQIHWNRTRSFESLLQRGGFRVVALARHPLDVLVSLASYVSSHPAPRSIWVEHATLRGEGGDETPLLDASPSCPAFLNYATGPRARALFGISRQWWSKPEACAVRYEDLVADPVAGLSFLIGRLGAEPAVRPEEAVAANSLTRLRALHADNPNHFWQGRPGLWRRLLTAEVARRIAAAQPEPFEEFGYPCDPDESLTPARAHDHWQALRPD